jgi:hypothetical protein
MVNNNFLFTLMFLCYLIPIIYVFFNYNNDKSISHIISNGTTNNIILIPMIFMSIFTIMYEIKRNNFISLIIIIFLIIGIIGIIFISIDKYMHYIYAYIVFICIILFMIFHTFIIYKNNILYNLLYINLFIGNNIIQNINNMNNIFIQEALFIGIFALFYIILHFQ